MKGEIAVRYTIRHFDLPLLTFEANMDSADTGLHIINAGCGIAQFRRTERM